MLVAKVIETEAQPVGHPGVVVGRARRRFAVGEGWIRGGERLHHLQAAGGFVAIGGQVNVVAPFRQTSEHRFEVAEVGEVPAEKQDPHAVLV